VLCLARYYSSKIWMSFVEATLWPKKRLMSKL
jgi:hypothetical protein